MATTEHTINDAIAGLLRETRHVWQSPQAVRSENTGLLKGSSGRPDILITEINVSPVVIETEVLPATTVESDATSRLGKQLRSNGRDILSSIAVRLPERLRNKQGKSLKTELSDANDLEMALYTGSSSTDYSRWPQDGWIMGNITDLSLISQSATIPPDIIDAAVEQLINGVNEAAGLLEQMSVNNPGAIHKIGEQLHQEDSMQTRRMATTILANAFMFHESLAGGTGELAEVKSIDELRGATASLSKSAILAEWRKILKVNYWPIFDISRRILEVIPTSGSIELIDRLATTAQALLANSLMRSHDLTGAVFQKLIADRKFLAAFYTTPASASLLVGLAVTPDTILTDGEWAKPKKVTSLRIADFACGTGTLLSTAYQRISQLHELYGGNAETLHPQMMATVLVGGDVLPAAAHLTASMLSGTYPQVKYKQSSIFTVPYGRQDDGTVSLGSIDLLEPQAMFHSLAVTAKALEGRGEAEKDTWRSLPHKTFDMVIMNPPFTRATGHEGNKIGVPNPMFAAFSSSEEEQRLMSKTTKRLTKDTSAHGNAGEASIFLALADRKLKINGMLALIMPLSLVSGDAWEKSRILLRKNYSEIIVISIVGADDEEMSFSADTGMGECAIIAKKTGEPSNEAIFIILDERPKYPLIGSTIASQIHKLRELDEIRDISDGPVDGTILTFGKEQVGKVITAPLPKSGGWNLARIADLSLAQVAYQLFENDRLWLPTMSSSDKLELAMTVVEKIGAIGPYHADINGKTSSGDIRGPLELVDLKENSIPTYPIIWSHNAEKERTLVFGADSEGNPKKGKNRTQDKLIEDKIKEIWRSASYSHFNQNFRFNSQSTAMQFTPQRTIGGRAWLSIKLSSVELEKALVLWGNTTLGLLLHWWHSNKQQSGRGNIGKTTLQSLPILDVTKLTSEQLEEVVMLFDEMKELPMLPIHQLADDDNRKKLDREFYGRVLGLDDSIIGEGSPLDLLRRKLGNEPSIRGNK